MQFYVQVWVYINSALWLFTCDTPVSIHPEHKAQILLNAVSKNLLNNLLKHKALIYIDVQLLWKVHCGSGLRSFLYMLESSRQMQRANRRLTWLVFSYNKTFRRGGLCLFCSQKKSGAFKLL